jgi:hypothetical protein
MTAMRVWNAAAIGTVVLLSMTACSSTTKGKPAGGSPSTSASTTPTTASATPSTGGVPQTKEQATAALLETADVGDSFKLGTYEESKDPQPCAAPGSPPLNTQVPPAVTVGREFDSTTPQAAVDEELSVYADEATAQRALTVGSQGMNCKTGKVYYSDGTSDNVTIDGPQDIKTALGVDVDDAGAWHLANKDVQGSLVVVRTGTVLTVLTFSAAADADTSKLPDLATITKTAITKVKGG